MKFRFVQVLLFLCSPFLLIAQNPGSGESAKVADSEPSPNLLKNELSINLAPIVSVALSGNWVERYELLFKRETTSGDGAYRLGLFYTREEREFGYMLDSSEVNIYREKVIQSLKAGYEWHQSWRRVVFLWGADFMMGYGHTWQHSAQVFFVQRPVDSISNSFTTKVADEFIFGLSPFIGFKVNILNHWSLTAHTSFRAVVGVGKAVWSRGEIMGNGGVQSSVTRKPEFSVDVATNQFISYLGIGFRF